MDPAQPFIDNELVYTDNAAYYSVSRDTDNVAYNSVSCDTDNAAYNSVSCDTDNPAYYSVSRGSNTKLADNYSTVKILPDKKNDGKEVVILPEKR